MAVAALPRGRRQGRALPRSRGPSDRVTGVRVRGPEIATRRTHTRVTGWAGGSRSGGLRRISRTNDVTLGRTAAAAAAVGR